MLFVGSFSRSDWIAHRYKAFIAVVWNGRDGILGLSLIPAKLGVDAFTVFAIRQIQMPLILSCNYH